MSEPTPESLALAREYISNRWIAAEMARRIDTYVAERAEKIVREHLANPLYSRRRLEERVAAADAMADWSEAALKVLSPTMSPNIHRSLTSALASYRALTKGEPTSIHTPDLEAGNG